MKRYEDATATDEIPWQADMVAAGAYRVRKDCVVATDEFDASHFPAKPRGRGGWMFRNLATGEEVTRSGRYADARRALPDGAWMLLP